MMETASDMVEQRTSSTTIRWMDDGGVLRSAGPDGLSSALGAAWCWVDLGDPRREDFDLIAGPFELHELSIEDALHAQGHPKADVLPEGVFLAWLTPVLDEDGHILVDETDFVLTPHGLITIHDGSAAVIQDVAAHAQDLMSGGMDHLVHAILDRLVDSVLPIADTISDRLEDIEMSMLSAKDPSGVQELHILRRDLLLLHRLVSPERDLLRALTRERKYISEDMYRYFDDIIDHLTHAAETLDTYRDIGSAVMDIHLSAQSNRLNEIMKVLTVITVIVGVMTLISGVYGMNLLPGMWPPHTSTWGFPAVVGASTLIALILVAVFRKQGWW